MAFLNKFLSAPRLEDDREHSYDAEPGQYEGYRDSKLPEGYTPYGHRYDPEVYGWDEYALDESPANETLKPGACEKSCCSIGRLVQFIKNDIDFSGDQV